MRPRWRSVLLRKLCVRLLQEVHPEEFIASNRARNREQRFMEVFLLCTENYVAAAGTALGIDEFHCETKSVREPII